jgi:hypothetical protein
MYLSRVSIKNYRSIRQLDVGFEPRCRILVGINESGKTNILAALNLLDTEVSTTRRDLREPGLREEPITEAHVRFIFGLTRDEASQISTKLKERIISKTYESPIIVMDGNPRTLDQFCESREGLYVANILTGKKYFSVWSLGKAQLTSHWKKVGSSCPADYSVPRGSESLPLSPGSLVDTSEFTEVPAEYLEEACLEDLSDPIAALIKVRAEEGLSGVLFWDYDESNLLPPRINLDQFCAKPDICLPLKRMFQLHEISDIQKEVLAAKQGSSNSLPNLLRRVAEKTTKHFHDTWREYDGIRFSLGTDGADLVAGIEDKSNRYELSQRSDGFKRFVTFLLMVSAEDASNLLKDTLLLIDEPEIGLHPSGARYLMEELIDISKNNYVIFSTHSIFMVDNKIINRHLIVRKDNEITEVAEVSESNIQDEEVIYKSLGYSIFSNLKEKNIIFEGWRDKKLFEVAISRVPSEYEEVKQLKAVGRCFAQGVKQIRNITPLFEAGDRKCLILSDCDPVAREQQREYQQAKGYGEWKRYDEVVSSCRATTGEDFIKETAFVEGIDQASQKFGIAALPVAELVDVDSKLGVLKARLIRSSVPAADVNRTLEAIKEVVFTDLKYSQVLPEYYRYLSGVLSCINRL